MPITDLLSPENAPRPRKYRLNNSSNKKVCSKIQILRQNITVYVTFLGF